MGADSKIEWCHHTFNPWWGCEKIDPECKNCYAASFAKRTGHAVWGTTSQRRFFGEKHWHEPLKWNEAARRAGERRRVFCASMADVFEDRDDLLPHRERLFRLIEHCDSLDWMLLTKRPEHMQFFAADVWPGAWPSHVWAGTTGGCQKTIDDNVGELLCVNASVHFLSAEPLLEDVNIRPYLHDSTCWLLGNAPTWDAPGPECTCSEPNEVGLDLVITGAESGPGARPMQEAWVRSLRNQIVEANAGATDYLMPRNRTRKVAFFYKQKLDERKQKVGLPLLDGRRWAEMPEVRL